MPDPTTAHEIAALTLLTEQVRVLSTGVSMAEAALPVARLMAALEEASDPVDMRTRCSGDVYEQLADATAELARAKEALATMADNARLANTRSSELRAQVERVKAMREQMHGFRLPPSVVWICNELDAAIGDDACDLSARVAGATDTRETP